MARQLSRKLLASAQRVKVFNSGLNVWLYDRSFREELKASEAFEVATDAEVFEQAMQGFVQDGRIISYDLMQDDFLDIAVAVREPLTAKELGSIPWREPQQAFLRLPTGRLVVESNDSLTIRSLQPTDPGAEVTVPPGDYLVTLHRVDWDTLAEDEIDWDGPSEFITLTSGPAAQPVRGQPAVLPWEQPEAEATAWKIDAGVYTGAAIFDDDLMAIRIALDQQAISQMGLQDRSVTLLSVPDVSFECALVWVRGDRKQGAYYDRLERLRPPAVCAGKEWAICNLELETPSDKSIFCLRRDPKVKVAKSKRKVWHPATMQVIDTRALERK